MTGFGLVSSLAWSGVVGYAVWRADGRIAQYIVHAFGVQERIALLQASDEARGKHRQDALTSIEIPDDLEAVAGLESELWARDDVRGMIREKYSVLGDWQKVRRAVGIAEMP